MPPADDPISTPIPSTAGAPTVESTGSSSALPVLRCGPSGCGARRRPRWLSRRSVSPQASSLTEFSGAPQVSSARSASARSCRRGISRSSWPSLFSCAPREGIGPATGSWPGPFARSQSSRHSTSASRRRSARSHRRSGSPSWIPGERGTAARSRSWRSSQESAPGASHFLRSSSAGEPLRPFFESPFSRSRR